MINWIKKRFFKAFLVDWVEGLLAKLPGNNYKTVIGLALTIILVVIEYLGGVPPGTIGSILVWLKDWLLSLGATPLLDGAMIIALVGFVHKVWKWIKELLDAREERTKPAKEKTPKKEA